MLKKTKPPFYDVGLRRILCTVLSFFFFFFFRIIRVEPATRHLDGLGPLTVHLLALHWGGMGKEGRAVGPVHVLELAEILPDVDREASCDGGSQRRRLVHGRAFNGDLNNIGLSLRGGH